MRRSLRAIVAIMSMAVLCHPAAHGAGIQADDINAVVITSDPQYPWTPQNDEGIGDGDTPGDRAVGEQLIREQYASIQRYRASRPGKTIPVIINGDLTAFGHGWQRAKWYQLLAEGIGGYHFNGLGNHDYPNNVDDCHQNGCARDTILEFIDHVQSRPGLGSFDMQRTTDTFRETIQGSLAYDFSLPGMHVIQLNNYPGYQRDFESDNIFQRQRSFRIRHSIDWVQASLERAGEAGAPVVIVNMHNTASWPAGPNERFRNLLALNDVQAVFGGHLHKQMGKYVNKAYFGEIPVFLSGSASQRTYLIVEHNTTKSVLSVYGVRNNDPDKKELLAEIPTFRRVKAR